MMDFAKVAQQLRSGTKPSWSANANTQDFARSLDSDTTFPSRRNEFVIPTKAELRTQTLNDEHIAKTQVNGLSEEGVYFCGNSLGLPTKRVSDYLAKYLRTWGTIAVGGHFRKLQDSPLEPFQDMAADCARLNAPLVGAAPEEVVIMNTLTVNLHMMMAAFYKPSGKRNKVMCEWRPFPSDYYVIESQIEWHSLNPSESMLLVKPAEGTYLMSTDNILKLIDDNADELALILLPGIQYYSGQLLDIPTITKHAHSRGILIGWDLAHAAGNVELKLHDWEVDFACWCTYKYMNAGAGAIAGAFVHSKHGTVVDRKGLRGWYGGDKSVRFLMDNKFVPTPGAQGYQVSNPSAVDLTCLKATLSIFAETSVSELRSRSLLLTSYAEHLLDLITQNAYHDGEDAALRIISPRDPLQRGAQLSVLVREDLMDGVTEALERGGVVCDKRKPGCIRVAPAPLYNTFEDVWRFMRVLGEAVGTDAVNGMDGHA